MRGIRKLHVASCVYCRQPMPKSADIVTPDGMAWGPGREAAHRSCAFEAAERAGLVECVECGRLTTGVGGSRASGEPRCDVCFADWYCPPDEPARIDSAVTTKPVPVCKVCCDSGSRVWWNGERHETGACDCQAREWGAK